MTDKHLIDPATLSGTELLLRQKYASSTLAATEALTKEALPVYTEVAKSAVGSLREAVELLKLKVRAQKLIELAKRTKEGN